MAKKLMNEEQLKSYIYNMVKESFETMPNGQNFEEKNDSSETEDDDSKKRNNRRRQQVEEFFNQPGVNPAQYAYSLYNIKPVEGDDTNDMKNARSKFMKCLHHEKNEEGYEYAFDSSEINSLYSMISGNQLKENKILMNEKQFTNFIGKLVNESIKKFLSETKKQPKP